MIKFAASCQSIKIKCYVFSWTVSGVLRAYIFRSFIVHQYEAAILF